MESPEIAVRSWFFLGIREERAVGLAPALFARRRNLCWQREPVSL